MDDVGGGPRPVGTWSGSPTPSWFCWYAEAGVRGADQRGLVGVDGLPSGFRIFPGLSGPGPCRRVVRGSLRLPAQRDGLVLLASSGTAQIDQNVVIRGPVIRTGLSARCACRGLQRPLTELFEVGIRERLLGCSHVGD